MQIVSEIKHLLNGGKRVYKCELIYKDRASGILKYVLERQYEVSGLILPAKSVTYAFYWSARPYTLYRWYYNEKNIGNYFNIADRIELKDAEFSWRDLVVDILIQSEQEPVILDEHELPADIQASLLEYIHSATNFVLKSYKDILAETDILLKQHCR